MSLSVGNLVGKRIFAVSIFRDREVELDAPPTWEQLFAFVLLNADLLLRPNFALGTWFDKRRGVHVIDIVICIPHREAAEALARHFYQLSIYDLYGQREIAIQHRPSAPNLGVVEGGNGIHAPH